MLMYKVAQEYIYRYEYCDVTYKYGQHSKIVFSFKINHLKFNYIKTHP